MNRAIFKACGSPRYDFQSNQYISHLGEGHHLNIDQWFTKHFTCSAALSMHWEMSANTRASSLTLPKGNINLNSLGDMCPFISHFRAVLDFKQLKWKRL